MNNTIREKLPDLIELEGDWQNYIKKVYAIFKKDFIDRKLLYNGLHVGMKKHPLVDGKEYTFYHITHEGNIENERTPDLRRCERIGWARPVIENGNKWSLKIWTQKRNGKTRICIWLELENEPDYIVILDFRKTYYMLWTAFTLQYDHEKRKREKEYQEYIKAKAEPGKPNSTS